MHCVLLVCSMTTVNSYCCVIIAELQGDTMYFCPGHIESCIDLIMTNDYYHLRSNNYCCGIKMYTQITEYTFLLHNSNNYDMNCQCQKKKDIRQSLSFSEFLTLNLLKK